jgi:hypothetical protein
MSVTVDFTTAGSPNWTVPTAVKVIDYIYVIGGGGGGGAGNSGGGGGAGAWFEQDAISTSPGTTWSLVVGAAGSGDSSNGGNSSWNSGQYVAGGGQGGVGSSGGAGGTVTGSPQFSEAGGNGGSGCDGTCSVCPSCTCDSTTCNGDMTCDDPPDCTHFSCNGSVTCNSYSCVGTPTNSSCTGQGGGGASRGTVSGNWASCAVCGGDNCSYCTGECCNNGAGGIATNNPSGDGGDGGSNAPNTGGGVGAGYGGGAGGGGYTGTAGFVRISFTAGHLTITQQPTSTRHHTTISPAITVEVRFSDGSVDTGYNGAVSVAISTNPSGGTLSGTTTVNASSGIATFSNLSIDNIGVGYKLDFTCTDVDLATSSAFDITVGTFNETASGGVVVDGSAVDQLVSANAGNNQVYAYNRPVFESVLILNQLRPSRAIK